MIITFICTKYGRNGGTVCNVRNIGICMVDNNVYKYGRNGGTVCNVRNIGIYKVDLLQLLALDFD